MAKIALVHGYGIGLTASAFPFFDHLGFKGFSNLIDNGEAVVFKWFKDSKINIFQFFNLFLQLKTYFEERKLLKTDEVLNNFKDFLDKNQPEIIVCHSIGCLLFVEYIKKYELPISVKKLVFSQADFPRNLLNETAEFEIKVIRKGIKFENYFCPWDIALFCPIILGPYIPAGLVGINYKGIKNHLSILFAPLNIHLGAIYSKGFVKKVLGG